MTDNGITIQAEIEVDIPFQDCDPMGVTWHGNYYRYLETARSALLDKIGYNYSQMQQSGYFWPVVDTRLKFVRPTRFTERISVTATLAEYENRLRIDYVIRNAETGERVTRGYTVQVAVQADRGEMCFCSPSVLIEKVRACARSG